MEKVWRVCSLRQKCIVLASPFYKLVRDHFDEFEAVYNDINLITDVTVAPNNKDDSKILNERIDHLKEKTPDLNELHMDAAYGSSDNDRKFNEHKITPVQSDMRGKEAAVPIEIEQTGKDVFIVSCLYQKVTSGKCKKRFKVEFDSSICNKCRLKDKCASIQMKKYRTFYFTLDDYLRNQRFKYRVSIPKERLRLRNNVEATINEFFCRMLHGKLKVRGAFKTEIFAYSVAISANFGRLFRHFAANDNIKSALFLHFRGIFFYFRTILGFKT